MNHLKQNLRYKPDDVRELKITTCSYGTQTYVINHDLMALQSTKNINSKTLVRFIKRGMELLQPQNETSKIPTPIQSQQKKSTIQFLFGWKID